MGLLASKIRIAVAADIPSMFKIRTSVAENHMSLEQLATCGITPETVPSMLIGTGRGWVTEDSNDGVSGFIIVNAAKATVFALFVYPEHEGRGLGRLLLTEGEQWLFDQGCKEIWLLTSPDLEVRAHGFYRHLGWIDAGVQQDSQTRFIKTAPQRA